MFQAAHRPSSGALTVFAAGRSPHAYVNQRLQRQLELLVMSGVPLETCWAFNKRWNNKFFYKVASRWLFLLSHTTMHWSMNIKLIIPVGRCRANSTTFPFSFRLKYLRNISMHVRSSAPAQEYRNASYCWLNDSVPRITSHNLHKTGKTPSTFEGTTFFRNDGNRKATQHHISEALSPQIY
jgi:hypothetical protein